MLILLTTVVLGIAFALFAVQNTAPASLRFGEYIIENIPIYLIVLIPLLLGLTVSYFIYLARDLSANLTSNEQKDKIKQLKRDLAEETKKAHKLELENTKFKAKTGDFDEDSI